MGIKKGWVPPRSPWGLIQEDLWPDAWKILVAGVMLNQTSRKQVEHVLPGFLKRWPTPAAFIDADPLDVREVIKPLGFGNRRTSQLKFMTRDFLDPDKTIEQYNGVGLYGRAAYYVFCEGKLPVEVKDHALAVYVDWVRNRHIGSTLETLFEELDESEELGRYFGEKVKR
jgi:hypothetical protein